MIATQSIDELQRMIFKRHVIAIYARLIYNDSWIDDLTQHVRVFYGAAALLDFITTH
jgi:hypothetical protein